MLVENNERLIDMATGGQLYGYKERNTAEILQINIKKRNKQLMKTSGGGGGMPNIGLASQ